MLTTLFALKLKYLSFCGVKVIKVLLTVFMSKIAIFASGSGTNVENLVKNFANSEIQVVRIYCNNPKAGVIDRAKRLAVPCTVFSKEDWNSAVCDQLRAEGVEYIILAGFLLLLPSTIIKEYNNKIINIHPSLLPKYGGKGMYGSRVHEAVIAAKEKESGITIHLVNEEYDKGEPLFQAKCPVLPTDTPDMLAARVHELEYKYFPQVVEQYICK
jgi:phosphoribosylglycinamide formyltransferase-1